MLTAVFSDKTLGGMILLGVTVDTLAQLSGKIRYAFFYFWFARLSTSCIYTYLYKFSKIIGIISVKYNAFGTLNFNTVKYGDQHLRIPRGIQ
jgi:hypothetical protein